MSEWESNEREREYGADNKKNVKELFSSKEKKKNTKLEKSYTRVSFHSNVSSVQFIHRHIICTATRKSTLPQNTHTLAHQIYMHIHIKSIG